MRFHWQNLDDGPIKKKWFHGRCWIGSWKRALNIEWVIPDWKSWRFGFGVNDGDGNNEWTFNFGCGLFTLYFALPITELPIGHWTEFQGKRLFIPEEREFKIYIFEYSLWICLWVNPMESRHNDPWWKKVHRFNLADLLLGRRKCTTEIIGSGETLIPMPEGSYRATYKTERRTWKRPRSFFKLQRVDFWLDIPGGIPHEGKGENSWDCGEDGLCGIGGETLEKAIGAAVSSVLNDRKRYGWRRAPKEIPVLNL